MSSTLLRQWTMLRMIPRHPRRITVAEIREKLADQGYHTTDRTIQRDLQSLSGELFALTADERSRPHGWYWAKDMGVLDIPGMEPQTALAFKLARQFLEPLMAPATLHALEPYFQQAGKVLDTTPGSVRTWPDKVRTVTRGQSLIPPEVDRDVLAVVYDALFEDRQFQARYRRRYDGEMRDYTVNPLGLVFRDGVIYLICSLFEYDDIRQLALHRMSEAEPLEAAVRRPPGFHLDTYLAEGGLDFRVGDKVRVCMELTAASAYHLEETPLAADQTLEPADTEGWVRLCATVPDTAQLRWWILGLGSQVRVLEPETLRGRLPRPSGRPSPGTKAEPGTPRCDTKRRLAV
jgi:predicted DNA-binding transcriptional regulator YafY